MLRTVTHKIAFQPTVNGPVVKLDIMVKFGLEFVGIEDLYGPFLPPGPYRLPFSQIDLNMHHSMRKRLELGVVIGGTVENQIPRFEVSLRQLLIRQQIELIGLVPLSKRVPELLTQIKHALSDQGAAVKEKRG